MLDDTAQSARSRVNQPGTSQSMAQLLEVINEGTKEMDEAEDVKEADIIKKAEEMAEEY